MAAFAEQAELMEAKQHGRGQFVGHSCVEIIMPWKGYASEKAWEEGTFKITLSGDGAFKAKNADILNHLATRNLITDEQYASKGHYFASTDSGFERLFWITGDPHPALNKYEATIDSTDRLGERLRIHIRFDVPCVERQSFSISPIPPPISHDQIVALLKDTAYVSNTRRDPNDKSVVWCNTTEVAEDLPHWIAVDRLIKSDQSFRLIRLSVPGRQQLCPHCGVTGHSPYSCRHRGQHMLMLRKRFEKRQGEVLHMWFRNQNLKEAALIQSEPDSDLDYDFDPSVPTPWEHVGNNDRDIHHYLCSNARFTETGNTAGSRRFGEVAKQ